MQSVIFEVAFKSVCYIGGLYYNDNARIVYGFGQVPRAVPKSLSKST